MRTHDIATQNPFLKNLQSNLQAQQQQDAPTLWNVKPATESQDGVTISLSSDGLKKLDSKKAEDVEENQNVSPELQELLDQLAEIYQQISTVLAQINKVMGGSGSEEEKMAQTSGLYQEVGVLQAQAAKVLAQIMKMLGEAAQQHS